jgi:Ca-activated chloride channel family protein
MVASLLSSPATLRAFQNPDSLVLNVTVTDKKGVPIRGLTVEDFSIRVDDQPQKILSLNAQESPISVGILIDVSGSQPFGNSKTAVVPRDSTRQGISQFIEVSHRQNEYFLMTFNSEVQLRQDWTSDPQAILQKVDSLIFEKQTSLYDALNMGIEKVTTGRNSKRLLVLISDGLDTSSKIPGTQVREVLMGSGVMLYCVGISNVHPNDLDDENQIVLEAFSYVSGGGTVFLKNAAGAQAFKEAFEAIALEVRAQYQIVIATQFSSGGKPKWHKVKIKATRTNPNGKPEQLLARTRLSYRT